MVTRLLPRCRAIGCSRRAAQKDFMCAIHWLKLTPLLKDAVEKGTRYSERASVGYVAVLEHKLLTEEEVSALAKFGYKLQGYNGRFTVIPPKE